MMRSNLVIVSFLVAWVSACGDPSPPGGADPDSGPNGGADSGPNGGSNHGDPADETSAGCAGVFNPDQVLDFYLEVAEADWNTLVADTTNSIYVPATFRCGDEAALSVAVRRKRSGGVTKVGLKVDFNRVVPRQAWHDLRKLSLENGISEGGTAGSVRDIVTEYLAWRMMRRSGGISGRAAIARVHVNGRYLGAYVNVEQVDKRFLRVHIGDDSGWLYKKSGNSNDGYQTNETQPNPYQAYFCFWERSRCTAPEDLATSLPERLDIEQMLRIGAVNALIANTDAPLLKDNNYLFYDHAGGPRVYLPWDLDTTMKASYDVVTGTVPGGTRMYTDVLFSAWKDDYITIFTELLDGPLSLTEIRAELSRVSSVAAGALDSDPESEGDTASTVAALEAWWTGRHADVSAQVAAQ